MLVRKFGGTSMGSADSLQLVAEIVKAERGRQVVVVSAMSGVTDQLLAATAAALAGKRKTVKKILDKILAKHVAAAKATIRDPKIRAEVIRYSDKVLSGLSGFLKAIGEIGELSPRSQNTIMAIGERLSSRLLTEILVDRGVSAKQADLEKAVPEKFKVADHSFYIATEKSFAKRLRKILAKKKVPIATGYFGWVPGGILAAVGRGYSDYCAALAAAGLRAERLEIWTDVSGIYTADPGKIKKAEIIDLISSEAAAELAHFGAKILHPQSIHPAIRARIPVWIKNTFDRKARGTEIVGEVKSPKRVFTSVTSKKGITVVNIASYRMLLQHGFLAKIFETFAKYEIPIDVVSTSEVSVSISIEKTDHLAKIVAELRPIAKITVAPKKAIVCLVGLGIRNRKGTAGEVFTVLGRNDISVEIISQGGSEVNITFVVDENEVDKTVKLLHRKFFENGKV